MSSESTSHIRIMDEVIPDIPTEGEQAAVSTKVWELAVRVWKVIEGHILPKLTYGLGDPDFHKLVVRTVVEMILWREMDFDTLATKWDVAIDPLKRAINANLDEAILRFILVAFYMKLHRYQWMHAYAAKWSPEGKLFSMLYKRLGYRIGRIQMKARRLEGGSITTELTTLEKKILFLRTSNTKWSAELRQRITTELRSL